MAVHVKTLIRDEKRYCEQERKDSGDEKGNFICRYFFQINFDSVKIITEFR